MIIKSYTVRAATVAALAFLVAGCDSGEPSRTADEFAADSALAADLALANRDTTLVDSIGAYREPDAAERDTAPLRPDARDSVEVRDAISVAPPPAATKTTPVAPAPAPPPPPAETKKPAATSPAPAASAPRLTGTRACTSSTQENQSECMRVLLAASDARLNRIYRALITEMKRKEGVAPSAKDPPSVQRLRVAQRSWLVYRDNECRKRGRGKEGRLWARPRARCLAEFGQRRANELADDFSRLTAR